MKILMLTLEYPPQNIGGLSNHVGNLARVIASKGHEVHVITIDNGFAPENERKDGVYVHRVSPIHLSTEDFIRWVIQGNLSIIEKGISLFSEIGEFDIIHAHDWSVTFAAKTLKLGFKKPLVCTIHSTEYGRNNGLRTDMQKYISQTEWTLTYESWKIIACSIYMKNQLEYIFNCPNDKIHIIPNGINMIDLKFNADEFRKRYTGENEKIVFFVGRHVYEKGIHILINSIPKIIKHNSNIKFIISGVGPLTLELKNRAKELNISDKILFVGYIDEESKNKLYSISDVAVFPSTYEPFGIVALEAMSLGCPVLVSDTGGLNEIVEHEVDGMKMVSGSESSLCENLIRILDDEILKEQIRKNGKLKALNIYSWESVALRTIDFYSEVHKEALNTNW